MKQLGLFEGDAPRVRTVPPSIPFLDLLAERMLAELARDDDPFALSDAIVLLPNRRAARGLMASFASKRAAALLPSIRPLGDLDDDPDVWGPDPAAFDADPAIDPLRRRLELAALLRAKAGAEGGVNDPVLAIAAADELCKLLDAASAAESVNWSRLPDLVPRKDLAQHWARSARFLEIISQYWPDRLAADHLMDPGDRRTKLLKALAAQWRAEPPQTPIIIAGSTGSVAAVRELMNVVAHLPRGVVVLPGLEMDADDDAWKSVGDQHPQHALSETLKSLGLHRADVPLLTGAGETESAKARRALIREALAPADITADWITRLGEAARPWGGAEPFALRAAADLALCEARTEDEEATIIALALREAVETPGQTAALVTPDNALAQRVSAKLKRWRIDAAVSAGAALNETPAGILLLLLAHLAADDADPVTLAALLKHPHVALRTHPDARLFEAAFLRGARCLDTLDAIAARTKDKTARKDQQRCAGIVTVIKQALEPLASLFVKGEAAPHDLAPALAACAEALAGTDSPWLGRDGDHANRFLTDLAEHGDALGTIARRETPRLISALMRTRIVPPDAEEDPRVAIWGPLEARMQTRDLIVLGGLNEGRWPAPPPEDPFLSRALRHELGLPSADARIGLAAHDFAQLVNAPRVILTRALRASGAPTIASRWLWRLQALIGAAGVDLAETPRARALRAWAEAIDAPHAITRTRAPEPRPAARKLYVETLSVTDVETLVRNPYALHAKRILGLRKLDPIGAEPDYGERGTAVHAAIEAFTALPPAKATIDALVTLLDAALREQGFPIERRVAYVSRVTPAAEAFVAWQTSRANHTAHTEITGALPVGRATLNGRADRIDIAPDGRAEIIDYKTGQPPSAKAVRAGFSSQLLLEAAMLRAGAFAGTPSAEPSAFVYWRFNAREPGPKLIDAGKPAPEAAEEALARLAAGLEAYDDPNRAFASRIMMEHVDDENDYDHLARWLEWGDIGEGRD